MKRVGFKEWLEAVKTLMVRTKIIKPDIELDSDSWKAYYDEGLNVFDTVVAEFGLDFKRRFIKTLN
jgi:hypothetical protein